MIDPNSPSLQLVGAVLNGRWRLTRLIGEGGMGAVFEADGLRGEGKRAVKLLHAEFAQEEAILQRFFAEAQTSSALQHVNIARVYEHARAEDGTPYLVMELLQGMPLASYIDRGQPIPPAEAAPIVYGILQALSVAHGRHVVHRDLKPDNVFLARENNQTVVKVLDFGIAKVMDAAGGMGNKTRTGVLLGTPGYMSPEQIKNSKGVDPRSDLWSAGVLFFEMLTLKLPYEADNEFSRLTAVLTDDAMPIERAAPHLVGWSGFFRKALAREAVDRFQTAEEMANVLLAVARGGSFPGVGSIAPVQDGASGPLRGPLPHAPAQTSPSPIAQTAPSAGKSTMAMPSVAEWNRVPTPAPRAGTGTVPSQSQPVGTPAPMAQGPSTLQGAQVAAGTQPYVPPSAPAPMQQAPVAPQRVGGTLQSNMPGAHLGANAQRGEVATHVSGQRPPGTPAMAAQNPYVQVLEAPPLPGGAAWWIVGVVGTVCFVVGFFLGFVVGR